jgi:hypothetical protein
VSAREGASARGGRAQARKGARGCGTPPRLLPLAAFSGWDGGMEAPGTSAGKATRLRSRPALRASAQLCVAASNERGQGGRLWR